MVRGIDTAAVWENPALDESLHLKLGGGRKVCNYKMEEKHQCGFAAGRKLLWKETLRLCFISFFPERYYASNERVWKLWQCTDLSNWLLRRKRKEKRWLCQTPGIPTRTGERALKGRWITKAAHCCLPTCKERTVVFPHLDRNQMLMKAWKAAQRAFKHPQVICASKHQQHFNRLLAK